ncbi:3-hydroxyacyl-ACP dehydratase FabZ family protein [Dokdonia donghaensis]|uniref:Hydroxymyristoyl-ACP dehydratase n=1 Tax=Dokdonia donghaensis DSW-1 TaxID=1300343 RepID=A0A0A2GUD3_9FLAO|nr:hydroxymyristoyl-ACP dehydratase [Dokdonia donghaensis]ANH60848.1 3-hydroxyacyl-[acyl-carrier-protein] dehydratase FabZ [Dokdonia donghaensis DSW-1]KGO05896.1 hydroxymyristoyl-ACP dehydratase [Dokdonia donghaensis DSW-1]
MSGEEIIAALPYGEPFLFVDTIDMVTKEEIHGSYTFKPEAFFYKGHFKDLPVTPGVILTECMAQIGLVSLGIFKMQDKDLSQLQVAFTNAQTEFLKPVLPGERVIVKAVQKYFRFNKLNCAVKLYNEGGDICAQGELAGIFNTKDEA